MNLPKIIRILVAVVGVLGIIFLARIWSAGDDVIKSAAESGDMGFVDGLLNPMSYIAYIVLAVVLFFVVIFSLKNILTHKHMLMTTIKNVGAFVALAAVAYFGFAEGVETPLRDGEILSASGSRWVGTGLYLFYFLVVIAVGAMFITGFKRMIKK